MGVKGKVKQQHCIDAYYFKEVLENIPAKIKIKQVNIALGSGIKSEKKPISHALRRLGVKDMRQPTRTVEVRATLTGPRSHMQECLEDISDLVSIDKKYARVKKIMLSYDRADATFEFRLKQKPTNNGKTEKWRVLGLESCKGDIQTLLDVLGAEKVQCKVIPTTVYNTVCTK